MKSGRTHRYETSSEPGTLKNAAGFTIIEVLIAMSILAVGLLAVATMQVSAIRVNSTARDITQRATVAQDMLEKLVRLPYNDPSLDITTGEAANTDSNPPPGFTVRWEVHDGPVAGSTKLIVVSVDEGGTITKISYVKPAI